MSADGTSSAPTASLSGPPDMRRIESTASLAAATCHIEDASQPCNNPSCGVHTATNTPAISRAVSHTDLGLLAAPEDRDDQEKSDDGWGNVVDGWDEHIADMDGPAGSLHIAHMRRFEREREG